MWKTELMESGDFRLFAANGKQNQQASIFCCKRKQNMEVSYPWSANDKRKSTIAVSANVPMYVDNN
jgi:hypothetical protein